MKMLWMLLTVFSLAQATPVRICVLEHLAESCSQMAEDLPETFTCVVAPDMYGCVEKVTSGEADVTNVDPNGMYLGGKFYNLRPIVTEKVDGETFRYQGIALVAKDDPSIQSAADLAGKKSCHTGYRRTVGWQIPVGKLLYKSVMEPSCDEGDLAAVSNFFGGSCVPGNWSSDPVVESELKKKYPKLCSACHDPSTCTADDTYAGYEGVIRCLSAGAADVSFTKIPVLKEYLEKDPSLADRAELLCFEGGRKDVNDADPCVWGFRPTNAFIARADDNEEEIERIEAALLNTQTRYSVPESSRHPDWYYKSFLSHPQVSGIQKTVEERRTYIGYLGEFINTIIKPRPGCDEDEHNTIFCVTSDEELFKCQDYSKAAEARGIWPNIRCLKTESKAACMEALKERHAEIVVLDGGDVYVGGRYYDLQPVAGELYGDSSLSYFAVAALRAASDVDKLAELRGLRSCHTGMARTAGWVMPVGILLSQGELADEGCNRANAVADFFSAGSCVPGANDTKYNPDRVRSDDLCKHCVGNDEGLHVCDRDSEERFSGYAGALRCLAEGKGDVSFIKHTTVPEYTDGRSELPWAKDLVSSDFKLLCGEGGTAPVTDYLTCNLGKVPAHYAMICGHASADRRLQVARILADSDRYFSEISNLYRLFRPRQHPDLLFKDSATGLKVAPLDANYEVILGERFFEASKAADPKACT